MRRPVRGVAQGHVLQPLGQHHGVEEGVVHLQGGAQQGRDVDQQRQGEQVAHAVRGVEQAGQHQAAQERQQGGGIAHRAAGHGDAAQGGQAHDAQGEQHEAPGIQVRHQHQHRRAGQEAEGRGHASEQEEPGIGPAHGLLQAVPPERQHGPGGGDHHQGRAQEPQPRQVRHLVPEQDVEDAHGHQLDQDRHPAPAVQLAHQRHLHRPGVRAVAGGEAERGDPIHDGAFVTGAPEHGYLQYFNKLASTCRRPGTEIPCRSAAAAE